MNLKDIVQSKMIRAALIGAGSIAVVLAIFQIGASVGYRKAASSYRMGENFHLVFDGGPAREYPGFPPKGLVQGHGASGVILKTELPRIIIETPDNIERSVIVDKNTAIRKFRETMKAEDLAAGNMVVVIGSPDDQGQIEAKLIRMFPSPEEMKIGR